MPRTAKGKKTRADGLKHSVLQSEQGEVTTAKASRQIERILLTDLRLDDRNARTHTVQNLEAICESLKRFGLQRLPIVDQENVVIAGNGLVMAARQLHWTHIDIVRTNLSGAEARAYAIADNRTAELAEWDRTQLVATLSELQGDDLLASTGFSDEQFRAFLAKLEPPEEFQEQTDQQGLDTTCPRCGFAFASASKNA